MKTGTVVLAMLVPVFFAQAQDCTCTDQWGWVKETFESNDAGFEYALEQKGEAAYELHNKAFAAKLDTIADQGQCTQELYQWMTFFRSGHIGIRNTGGNSSNASTALSDDEIRRSYAGWRKHPIALDDFKQKLTSQSKPGLEGIWESPPYRIAIEETDEGFIGSVLEADGVYWTKDQVKFIINKDLESATFYMRDHSAVPMDKVQLFGSNLLMVGFVDFQRVWPEYPVDKSVERYTRLISAQAPYIEKTEAESLILRIPSFNFGWKQSIDSILAAHKNEILSTPHLIIDIRNNGGGSDASYSNILPFLYTNPIRTVGVDFLSTPLNNQRMLNFVNNENWSDDDRKWAQDAYDTLSNHMGEFVNLNGSNVSVDTYDTVYTNPSQVSILINENNGSTTEQFLLAAKQSRKVKLYGTTTVGVLDISNMHFVDAPCGNFQLGYSLSKSRRIPHMTIDGKGLQPDFNLGLLEPYKWIEYVEEMVR